MAVIVVNCPVRMMSLSKTALTMVKGTQHDIAEVIRPSTPNPHEKNYDANTEDGFYVITRCGNRLDAYPETKQGLKRCTLCDKSKKETEPLMLIRLIPPVSDQDRWSSCYWDRYTEDGFTAYLMQRDSDDVAALRERTSQPSPSE